VERRPHELLAPACWAAVVLPVSQHAFRLAETYAERIGVRLYACHLRITVLTNIFMYPVT
jgi:hypothetical protein